MIMVVTKDFIVIINDTQMFFFALFAKKNVLIELKIGIA